MVGSQIARNIAQKIPQIAFNGTATDNTTVIYTCPAGKKAQVTGFIQVIAFGATAVAGLSFGGVGLDFHTTTDQIYARQPVNVTLKAGDKIQGDGSVNLTVNYLLGIQESAV